MRRIAHLRGAAISSAIVSGGLISCVYVCCADGRRRVAELVATLSYAADLGLGQPMAHCMRQTVIALRLADLVGATQAEREATYYLGLMINAYCHADAAEQASWFGDDIAFKSDGFEISRDEHGAGRSVPGPPRRRARQRARPRPQAGRIPALEHAAGDGIS